MRSRAMCYTNQIKNKSLRSRTAYAAGDKWNYRDLSRKTIGNLFKESWSAPTIPKGSVPWVQRRPGPFMEFRFRDDLFCLPILLRGG
jgi:hypothetical protein